MPHTILVLGLGLHGGAIGTITWLASDACPKELRGARIIVADKKSREELAPSLEKLNHIPDITYVFGEHDSSILDGVTMIIRNPAVLRSLPLLEEARRRNIPIEMDSSLFFQYSPSASIIGITGSKGKTTTSSAIFHVLKSVFPDTIAVGIDGISPLLELPLIKKDATAVFELSSWRLEALQERNISPHIAVATSIYKDHLNTYDSFAHYIEVKKQIIRNQTPDDIAILNADDATLKTWEKDVKGSLYWFSLAPLPAAMQGIWVEDGEIHTNIASEHTPRIFVSDIPHASPHELRNKLPSLLIALLQGVSLQDAARALADMKPMKYRLETIVTVRGVTYINDSAATMPDATIAALQALQEKPLVLILGGSDKALEFEGLSQAIATSRNIKALVWLPGTATERMKATVLRAASLPSYDASSMQEAVALAAKQASAGDIVLLSPGATSFGLFLHEFDRGYAFNRAIEGVY